MRRDRGKQMAGGLTRTRRSLQGAAVLGTLLIGVRHVLPGEASSGGAFDAFCPFGGIETLVPYVATGSTLKTTNLLNFSLLLGVLGVALLAGRAFCGWLCPLGAVQEWLAMGARRLTGEKRHIRGKQSPARLPLTLPAAVDRPLRYAKYVILAAIVALSVVAVYPPLHSLCPVRAMFGLRLNSALLWIVLGLFVLSSLLVERFSCKYLCPLGAATAVFNKLAPLRIVVDGERCNRCGRCEVECPMGVAAVHANTNDPECIRCLECVETCARQETMVLELG
ncbi:MAG: 4Fe-4S binding protein [Anaerolineae bacterium]|nr:4Fe-4S binding protein [Anaerolineae bacterium]